MHSTALKSSVGTGTIASGNALIICRFLHATSEEDLRSFVLSALPTSIKISSFHKGRYIAGSSANRSNKSQSAIGTRTHASKTAEYSFSRVKIIGDFVVIPAGEFLSREIVQGLSP